MAMSKEELLKAKLAKQNQEGKSAFDVGSEPVVPTRDSVVEAATPAQKGKELKSKRIQILTYESLIDRMDAYADRQGMSRAEVFEAAVAAFLSQHDK